MNLILLGAPSAGKGTQAEIISQRLCIPAISTGRILRQAVQNETPIGKRARTYMESGGLVPDDLIVGIVTERLREPDCKNGFILDGVPRTINQAEALEDAGVVIDLALLLEISDAEVEARMTGRRVCANCSATYHIITNPPKKDNVCDACRGELTVRDDDRLETVKNRLKVYHLETEPLIEYYQSRGKLKVIDNQSIEATTEVIFKALGDLR